MYGCTSVLLDIWPFSPYEKSFCVVYTEQVIISQLADMNKLFLEFLFMPRGEILLTQDVYIALCSSCTIVTDSRECERMRKFWAQKYVAREQIE